MSQDLKCKVYLGCDLATVNNESCATIMRGDTVEAIFYGKEANIVFNMHRELTEREAKLVGFLDSLISHKRHIRTNTFAEAEYWINQFRLCIKQAEKIVVNIKPEDE